MPSISTTRLRSVIYANGALPIKEYARRAQISQGYLCNIASDRNKTPSLDCTKRIAKAIGVKVSWLLEQP